MEILKNFTRSLMFLLILGACTTPDPDRFTLLSSDKTGIQFENTIVESDSINILVNEYIYNGGGVAVADFNQDGLPDLYFTGNMVPNEMYLNLGRLEFENVTTVANVAAESRWSSGVAVVDINLDGWPDLYVCATNRDDPQLRKNTLFIHQGLNPKGQPVFKDLADDYGLADISHTTNAAFFDYDNDGDLDVYLVINEMDENKLPNTYKKKITDGTSNKTDKLFKNDWDENKGHPVFTDISNEAGILIEGFGLGINISDINKDGWKDIYVSNDYITNDLLYINNRDGTFTDQAPNFFKHTSHSAMGNDVVDINNDGLPDVIALDMLPEDNFRRKTMLMGNNYNSYINNDRFGYQYQYVRNTLQLNQGVSADSSHQVFSEIAMLAGISATDWSWAPLVADFDNDGFKDIIVTNGFPKDITDRDFIDYHQEVSRYASNELLRSQIPEVKIKNYAFRNNGNLTFENVTDSWGIDVPSFSNGAAYVDLDNDGDLDYVVNNINDKAFVYRNNTIEQKQPGFNWLKVKLSGDTKNPLGYGTSIEINYGEGQKQYLEHTPFRGYLSSVDQISHFGLGSVDTVKELVVTWPDGKEQIIEHIAANQLVTLDIKDASVNAKEKGDQKSQSYFSDITAKLGIDYSHQETDYIDFNVQRLLPHKLSQFGPGIAVGDVNGDELEDFYVSGTHTYPGQFFIQQASGQFATEEILIEPEFEQVKGEELGVLLFDADGDGDLDLYRVNGGYEFDISDSLYQDQFFINQGGQFTLAPRALPSFLSSGSCVKAADYDQDGDLDLFVGGRVLPENYPESVSSFILRNDSEKDEIHFSMAGDAPDLKDIGMVSDALWTDFDQDGWVDLLLAGEWMPLVFLKNIEGKFTLLAKTGLEDKVGWWNSLSGADFDHDGDIDYLAGNLGLNTLMRSHEEQPVSIYASDFDGNGSLDAIPGVLFPDSTNTLMEFPYFGRMDMEKQINRMRKDYPRHEQFARATMSDVLSKLDNKQVTVLKANYFESSYIENLGQGKFQITTLPIESQFAPVYGMAIEDYNGDGFLDVALVGNDFGTETSMGKYDALNGLVLLGDGGGGFEADHSGSKAFYVPGDAKSLAKIRLSDDQMGLITTQNRGELKIHLAHHLISKSIELQLGDAYALVDLQDGISYREEFYYGSTFLSQSSRTLSLPSQTQKVEIIDYQGNRRVIDLSTIYSDN